MPCFWCKLFIWFQYYQGEYFQWYLLYIKAWSWVVVFSLPVILGMVNKVWCKRDTVCLLLCDIMQQNFWYPTVHSHYKKGLQDITHPHFRPFAGGNKSCSCWKDQEVSQPELTAQRATIILPDYLLAMHETCPDNNSLATTPAQCPWQCLEVIINVPVPSPSH